MSGWREVPYTGNRKVVYDLLNRARRFHAPVTVSAELDVTDTLARIRAERREGRAAGMVPFLVRASALLVRRHPSLQRHLFTSWTGRPREVVFDRITCTLVVARRAPGGEEVLLPLNLVEVDTLSVEDIAARVREAREAPLETLPSWQAFQRVQRLPALALTWFSYKARSDPDFYLRYFGTYGLSSVLDPGGAANAMSTMANTAVALLPSTLRDRPWVVDGRVVPRRILNLSMVMDHHLVDGGEMLRIGHTLRRLVERPDAVFSPPGPGAAGD